MNSNVSKAIYFTAGLSIGGGATYFFVKRKYRLLADEEVASVKDVFEKIYEKKLAQARDDWSAQPDPEEAAPEADVPAKESRKEAYERRIQSTGYSSRAEDPEEVVSVKVEIEDGEIDVTVEESERDPNQPYIIDIPDFYNSEYDQVTLTYWVVDNVLSDERDVQVEDVDSTIGNHHLRQLSKMREEQATIYIRNELKEIDFEIVKSEESFAKAVHGIDEYDDADKSKKKLKKMRSDDG